MTAYRQPQTARDLVPGKLPWWRELLCELGDHDFASVEPRKVGLLIITWQCRWCPVVEALNVWMNSHWWWRR